MEDDELFAIESLLREIKSGNESAKRELIEKTFDRLRMLTRKMLRGFSDVRRWEETDDVWQNVSMRIWKSLDQVEFESARHFLNLSALQIRRELLNLVDAFRRPGNAAAHHVSPGTSELHARAMHEPTDPTNELDRLVSWTELHEKVAELDDELREVFQLLWYQGLTQEQVSEVTGVSIRTVRRRWQAARLELYDQVNFDS